MLFILNTLGPVITLVVLGVILRSRGFVSPAFFKESNTFVFWIGLPALLFSKASEVGGIDAAAMKVFFSLLGTMFAVIFIGYVVAFIMKTPARSVGAFVQGGYRNNLAFVGIPVVAFALEGMGASDVELGRAIIVIIPLMICYNIVAIPLLLVGQKQEAGSLGMRIISALTKIGSNPIILSAGGGLLFGMLGFEMPTVAARTIHVISGVSMPLALMGVGAALIFDKVRPVAFYAAGSVVIKIMVGPLVCYAICTLIGLSGMDRIVAVLYMSSPTAAISYVMAEQLGGDSDLAAGIIVLSTLFAPIPLGIILALS